ncbi:MAG TPA: Crp/Fnr family transcriptional regulator [Pyrinomonadaceae bacterium]|nr:Crp/Fnr family transcriptional regulator [Pyrinomonadaceae bacterium]
MTRVSPAIKNLILAALPRGEYERLSSEMEFVTLPLGARLYRSGGVIGHVYFPSDALVSVVTRMRDGANVEAGLIGRDGMVGVPVLLGDGIEFEEAVVQIGGGATRMRYDAFKEELKNDGSPLLTQLLLYSRDIMKQVAQTAACNRRHKAEKRLARWLLMCRDRTESDDLPLTQEFISGALGARRAGLSGAAATLREEGFIRYSRGHITMLNRAGLEEFACRCYRRAER